MNALGINTANSFFAYSSFNVNQNTVSQENSFRNKIDEKSTRNSDEKISKLIDKVNSESRDITTSKVRPQLIQGAPIGRIAESDKVFFDKYPIETLTPTVEKAIPISVRSEMVGQISNEFTPRGFFISVPDKQSQNKSDTFTITQSERLLRKYKNDDLTLVGSLVNMTI